METESDAVAHAFGVALHRLREERGLSLRALGDQVHYSYSQLSRAERGEHLPSPELVKKVDDELRAGGLLTALRALGPAPVPPGPKRRGPSAPRLHLAVGATVTLHMQTPTGEAVQVALSRRHFNELLSAGVLRMMLPAGVTDPEQADRAARILSGEHAADPTMIGYFHRMLDEDFTTDKKSGPRKLIGHTLAQISLLRQLRTGAAPNGGDGLNHLLTRYAEFAGWLHQDLGDTTAATYWTGEAMRWAQLGDDPTMQAYLLVRSSNIALLDRNARDVIESAAAARRVAGPIHPRLHALAAQQEARGWALAGDADRFQTGLDEARDLLMRYPADHDPSLPVYLNSYGPEVLEEQSTNGFRDCGQPEKAVLILERRIKAAPSDLHRDNGHLLAKLARAVVALPHPEPGRALTLGLRSAHEARSTASARISRELHGLDRIIQNRWPTLPGRQQLREALSALTMPANAA